MNGHRQREGLWQQLTSIFRESGLQAVLGRQREHVMDRLAELDAEYQRHVGGSVSSTLPATATVGDIVATYESDPYSVSALLQALAFGCSGEMLAMMWLVMKGARITALQFRYERGQMAEMAVTVELPRDGRRLVFQSRSVWDAAILRFVGVSTADDRPLMDGFYPLHLGERGG